MQAVAEAVARPDEERLGCLEVYVLFLLRGRVCFFVFLLSSALLFVSSRTANPAAVHYYHFKPSAEFVSLAFIK